MKHFIYVSLTVVTFYVNIVLKKDAEDCQLQNDKCYALFVTISWLLNVAMSKIAIYFW